MHPIVQTAIFPLDNVDLAHFLGTLERLNPGLLPQARHLLLGRYVAKTLLPPGLARTPTTEEIEEILLLLQQEGLQKIATVVQELAEQSLKDSTERDLNYLESLPSTSWHHPAEVLSRPWNLARLLTLCDERRSSRSGAQRKTLLRIKKKLSAAQKLEQRAAKRRQRRQRALAEED
jgi:hypothetical protein